MTLLPRNSLRCPKLEKSWKRHSRPEADKIEIVPRNFYKGKKEDYRPFNFNGSNKIAPMIKAGEGYNIHLTGLTHDERGYPALDAEAQDKNVRHLVDKIIKNEEKIRLLEEEQIEDAEVIVISYGITSRVSAGGGVLVADEANRPRR